MTNIIVLGHGGYAEGIKRNLQMLMGDLEHYYFLDFFPGEDLELFKEKLNQLISDKELKRIFFVCDLTGGSPFREACILSLGNDDLAVVAGVNTAALSEISFILDETPQTIAKTAVEVTKESVLFFSEDDE
jgi:PTS system N-acetylgalactosamine-specific IIA component